MPIEPTDRAEPMEERIKALWIRAVESGCFNDPIARVVDRFIVLVASEVEASRQLPAASYVPNIGWGTEVRDGKPRFAIGYQSFTLDYDDSEGQAEWMREQLESALRRLAAPASQRPAAQAASAEPVFWYRPCSDGGYEGPLHHNSIEDIRKRSGGWVPLYATPPGERPAAPAGEGAPADAQTIALASGATVRDGESIMFSVEAWNKFLYAIGVDLVAGGER
jgi:hypothetical protein